MADITVVTVKVVLFEDEQEVGAASIAYFPGQEYVVKIDTLDGVDAKIERKAGD